MAKMRESLSQMLRRVLPKIKHFYFSPPSGHQMKYPCVVYERAADDVFYADDIRYLHQKRYVVTIIDENPDSEYSDEFLDQVPYASFDRFFTSGNLNHFVHTLSY